jgi:molecular chaperone GrpE
VSPTDPNQDPGLTPDGAVADAEAAGGAPAAGATGDPAGGAAGSGGPVDAAAPEGDSRPQVDSDPGDGGQAVEQDLEELVSQVRAERDEYLDLAQRTRADFDNYRRRMTAETAAATERGRLEVVAGIIEAIDNLERVMASEGIAFDAALEGGFPEGAPVSLQGVIVAYRDLHSALRRVKVEAYDPAGEVFDPNLHEALQAIPADGVDTGVVVEVMQRGYRAGEQVIRPARVVVSQ